MLKKCVTMEVLKSKINSCYCVTGLKVLSRNLFACLQEVISSFRLLSEARSGLQIIKYFSHRHKLQRFEAGCMGQLALGSSIFSNLPSHRASLYTSEPL